MGGSNAIGADLPLIKGLPAVESFIVAKRRLVPLIITLLCYNIRQALLMISCDSSTSLCTASLDVTNTNKRTAETADFRKL